MATTSGSERAPARRLLMVALRYPPQGGVGIIRTCKFERYLPEFGWTADVLTGPGGPSSARFERENSEIGPGVVTRVRFTDVRARALQIERSAPGLLRPFGKVAARALRAFGARAYVPDESIPFFDAVRNSFSRLRSGYDAVYSSAIPWTDHLVAAWLAEQLQVPLVLDFRDPWIESEGVRNSGRRYRREVALEKRVVERADLVLSTATGLREDFKARFPQLPDERFKVIYNGYDEEDFARLARSSHEGFRIAHTGNFYGSKGPEPLFVGLQRFRQEHPELAQRVRLQLVGRARPKDRELAERLGLSAMVDFTGLVSHRQALQYVVDADLLVAVDFQGEQARMRVISKSFEYLRSGNPILFLSAGGETERILHDSGRASIVAKDDTEGVVAALAQRMSDPPPAVSIPDEYTARFARRELTGQLARELDRLTAPAGG